MSKPTRLVVFVPRSPTVASVPALLAWVTRISRRLSTPKSCVDVVPAKLLVYALPTTLGLTPSFTSPGP